MHRRDDRNDALDRARNAERAQDRAFSMREEEKDNALRRERELNLDRESMYRLAEGAYRSSSSEQQQQPPPLRNRTTFNHYRRNGHNKDDTNAI